MRKRSTRRSPIKTSISDLESYAVIRGSPQLLQRDFPWVIRIATFTLHPCLKKAFHSLQNGTISDFKICHQQFRVQAFSIRPKCQLSKRKGCSNPRSYQVRPTFGSVTHHLELSLRQSDLLLTNLPIMSWMNGFSSLKIRLISKQTVHWSLTRLLSRLYFSSVDNKTFPSTKSIRFSTSSKLARTIFRFIECYLTGSLTMASQLMLPSQLYRKTTLRPFSYQKQRCTMDGPRELTPHSKW